MWRRRPARAAAVQPLLVLVVLLLMLQLGRPVPASASAARAADRQGQASRGPRIVVAQELPQQFA